MTSVLTPGRLASRGEVIECLAAGATVAEAERVTRWPARSIHGLRAAERWRLLPDGRVLVPAPPVPRPAPVVKRVIAPALVERCGDDDAGTLLGYRHHRQRDEPTCAACREARRVAQVASRARTAREQAEQVAS